MKTKTKSQRCCRLDRYALPATFAAFTVCQCPTVPLAAELAIGIPDPSVATSLPAQLADPGSVRKALAERGITGGANYIGEYFGVASGGLNHDGHYDGRLELYIDANLETMENALVIGIRSSINC